MNEPESETERKRTLQALAVVSWVSCVLFAVRNVGFFLRSYFDGNFYRWKVSGDQLYRPDKPRTNAAMSLHIGAAAVILALGAVQLLPQLRKEGNSWIHRWIGRLYVMCSILTSVGGLYYIATAGTVGGFDMDVAFSAYGCVMFISALQTWRHARKKSWERHKLWSWRLYSMALASWLFRIEYGIILGPDGVHPLHELTFTGPLDKVMNWFFFVPNLAVVEYIWRHNREKSKSAEKKSAIPLVVLKVITIVVLIVTVISCYVSWAPNAFGRAGPWMGNRLRIRVEQQQQKGISLNDPFDWTKIEL